MIKQLQYFGKTASGVFVQPLFGEHWGFEKTAGAHPFAEWSTGDSLAKFISSISAADRKENCYTLVNALGAGEYFGSNINADYFPWNSLAHEGDDYGYQTFYKAHAYQHHKNKDPSRAFGIPVLSVLNHEMKRVELVIKLNREKAKAEGADGIITRIDQGDFPDVSMGCKVPADYCSICGNASKTEKDYCEHFRPSPENALIYGPNKILADGRRIFVYNYHPRFFDISFVFIGADKTAKVMAKLASAGKYVCLGDVCTIDRSSAEVSRIVDAYGDPYTAPLTKVASNDIYRQRLGVRDGLTIWLVDGTKVRNRLYTDFVMGGTSARYKFIPENEVWIDNSVSADELKYTIEHEFAERKLMTEKGLSYDKAHDKALKVEEVLRKKDALEVEKKASGNCGCGGECCDEADAYQAFGVKKESSHKKISEIIKTVPAGTTAIKSINDVAAAEPNLKEEALKELAHRDLGSSLSTSGLMGIILKPQEFQRITLIRMGEEGLSDSLDSKGIVFRDVSDVDRSIGIDKSKFDARLMMELLDAMKSRSALGSSLQIRIMKSEGKKHLPTKKTVSDPLLDKISAAYNGYRQNLLEKISQVQEVVMSDPTLRDRVLDLSVTSLFTKTSGARILSQESVLYYAGAHLQNKDLFSETTIEVDFDR